eukprot:5237221-Amphidinium_carterae.1
MTLNHFHCARGKVLEKISRPRVPMSCVSHFVETLVEVPIEMQHFSRRSRSAAVVTVAAFE